MSTPFRYPLSIGPSALLRTACASLLLTTAAVALAAPVAPDDRAERWWDASRAERIGYSDRAAAACKSQNCDSLQIRSCLNDQLKPPTPLAMRGKTIAEVTAACIAGFKGRP